MRRSRRWTDWVQDARRAADDRAFFVWIKAIALRRAGRLDEAAGRLRAALGGFPRLGLEGQDPGRAGGRRAGAKHPDEAERLARAEVEALLTPGAKDRLAAVVEGFAARLLEPGRPAGQARARGSLFLAVMARALARGDERGAASCFRMATASRAAGKLDRAASDLRTYLADHPRGADQRGRSSSSARSCCSARATARPPGRSGRRWPDSSRRPAKSDPAVPRPPRPLPVPDRTIVPRRARGRRPRRAATGPGWGSPRLRRFLAAEPGHATAVEAAYQVADAEWQVGRSEEALVAFRRSSTATAIAPDRPRHAGARPSWPRRPRSRSASSSGSRAGWPRRPPPSRATLDRFPNGPRFADAQRSILDTELEIADEHDRHGRFGQARAVPRGVRRAQPARSPRPARALPQRPEPPGRRPGRSGHRRLGEPDRPVPRRRPGGPCALGDCPDLRGEEGRSRRGPSSASAWSARNRGSRRPASGSLSWRRSRWSS